MILACSTGGSALPAQPSRDAATSPRAAGLHGPDERSLHMGRRSSQERADPGIWPCHLGLFPNSPREWGLCVITQPGAAGTAGGRAGPWPQVQAFLNRAIVALSVPVCFAAGAETER